MEPSSVDEVVSQVARRLVDSSDPLASEAYVVLLKLLYLPLHTVEANLPASLHAHGIPLEKVLLQRLVGVALNMEGSGHWADLAAAWLDDGLELDEALAEEIDHMTRLKRGTQRARHTAFRFAHRWRKAQDAG